ncbi:NAD(P)-dependent oxidoreductase [Allostreptomyces psammosilenae]|uniref:3-hydroxyisobutyrate dehydrogenase-like beta-hydroxyacid dehydrogenase n=1 Tax=Allostreptomyces psammosilenae TaxID=1892865 RepID=A0A852ZX70_9ACTN|nr:NAD(P)-binding domain-containing protein [Allostreptomyces psammosilenae]NYI06799.1 3-hydroxyisobutyrate dehydrogenase-like beta-hydroxyacid dehydrogenase [Allostreptomyces psammosilenae]
MTGDDRAPVTVVGLGSMGRALAEAFLAAGHPTTVWNRTAGRAAPLVDRGARRAATVEDAVRASPLVVTCLSTYDATRQALEPAAAALAGRTVVTLNSGGPHDARETAAWASAHGARFLDGAVKNVPQAVGGPDTLLYYSGDRAVFDEHEATLRALGGDTVHLGDEVDLAALYESAVGSTLLPALVGFFHGAALITARGLPARSMVPYSIKWFEMISSILPALADEIDAGDYGEPFSAVGLFDGALADEQRVAEEAGVDADWMEPMYRLVRRAVEEGHADHNISALVEVLRKPERAE